MISGTEHWSEYDSDTIYADYDIVSEAADVTRMYLPGIAEMDSGAINPEYFHSDQVGSMRAMTDSSYPAQVVRQTAYTAFGERVASSGSTDTRYGYVGAHGYEETLLPGWDLLHVGARWYDPATGRFLQRDPIGIRGSLNVYAYVGNNAVAFVDPSGLHTFGGLSGQSIYREQRRPGKSVEEAAEATAQMMTPCNPLPPLPPNPVNDIQSQRQAQDLANVSATGILALGTGASAATGNPVPIVVAAAVVFGAYLHDYIARYW